MGKDGMECPAFCPVKCGPGDMRCHGGMDGNDCMMPDFCYPSKGPAGKDGTECWNSCPMKCGPEDMICGGEMDPWSGCRNPEWCMPSKGKFN